MCLPRACHSCGLSTSHERIVEPRSSGVHGHCVASAVDYPWIELCDPLLRDRRWGNTALHGCSQGALYGRGLQQVEEGPAQENAIDAASSFLRGNTIAGLLLRVRSLAVRELPCQALCGVETTLVLTSCSRLWRCRPSSLGATRIVC